MSPAIAPIISFSFQTAGFDRVFQPTILLKIDGVLHIKFRHLVLEKTALHATTHPKPCGLIFPWALITRCQGTSVAVDELASAARAKTDHLGGTATHYGSDLAIAGHFSIKESDARYHR